MALQVASLVDQAAIWPEWATQTLEALNGALSEISVSSGYQVMVTIADRSYVLSSGKSGRLQVTQVSSLGYLGRLQVAEALKNSEVRIIIDGKAWDSWTNTDAWTDEMMAKRQLKIEGHAAMLTQLQQELEPHLRSLQGTVETKGPSSAKLKQALDEHKSKLEDRQAAKEMERSELLAYEKDVSLQLALTEDNCPEMTLFPKVQGWLVFSAGSTMFGNMGQGNYVAANCLLDAMTFHMRTTDEKFDAHCLMWGAVSGLGMRWKAFASADTLLQNEAAQATMISYMEALKGIQMLICGVSPEWVHVGKFDEGTWAFFLSGGFNSLTAKDPWGFGKGGGVTVHQSSFHQRKSHAAEGVKAVEEELQSSTAENPGMRKDDGVWLYPGRRVRIHGLVIHSDLNERKGTLIEEVAAGTWHVKLDDAHGEKLLKVQNMKTLAGVPLDVSIQNEKQGAEAKKPADKHSFEFSLAGTWTNWEPQDMQWDAKQQCFSAVVHLNTAGGFGITRGKAGEKWKVQKQEWKIGAGGHFQIRLFVTDSGKVKKVDWILPGASTSDVGNKLREPVEDETKSQPVSENKENKDVAPAEVARPPTAVSERQRSSAEPAPSQAYCIAGTWLDWTPQDMQWDTKERCFVVNAHIEDRKQGGFGICRGKAGSKWKSQREEWAIKQEGHYKIRLYVKESGGIKKVDWVRRVDVQDGSSNAK